MIRIFNKLIQKRMSNPKSLFQPAYFLILAFLSSLGYINIVEASSITHVIEMRAQDSLINISGVVVDATDIGIPNVNVSTKNGKARTKTDDRGSFTITALQNEVLIFSSVGYVTKEVVFEKASGLSVILEPHQSNLNEVVVIGYGSQRKSDLTGSIGVVKEAALQERPSASLNQALAGRVAGVNVSTNSGRPGGNTNVRIRGNTSISVTNNPLYVIDGVILNVVNLANASTPIDYINPNDIASIEVLKDASATAIYGARGANGVILVTTKRGGTDGSGISYDTDISLGKLPKKLALLNSEELLRVEEIQYENAEKFDPEGWASGRYTDPKAKRTDPRFFDAQGNPRYDTDWQDETYRLSLSQNHQLSFTGKKDKDTYGAYLGYRDDQGIIKKSALQRYSARLFHDIQIRDWWKVGTTLSYNDQRENQVDDLGHGGITVMREIVETIPIIPVTYADGSWASSVDYPGMGGGDSPLQLLADRSFHLNTQSMIGNLYTNIKLKEGLVFRSIVGASVINQRTSHYAGKELVWISADQNGSASINNNRNDSYQFESYLTYDKRLKGVHAFNGMLGLSWQHVKEFSSTARAQNFLDDFFGYNNLGVGATPLPPASNATAYGLNSYFGRINYGFKDRYLVTFTGRLDGSSKFGDANRYAFFPSTALAWRISEENFMTELPAISNLKLRTSIGYTGNSEVAAYQALAGLGNYSTIFNRQRVTGIGQKRLANPGLKWEKTQQIDVGLELGLFNNRISIEADIYRKLTTDMLLDAPVPASTGYLTMYRNVGSMENKGIELALNTININADKFSWSTTFNISINKNNVLALGEENDDIFPGPSVLAQTNVIRVGKPVGSFYGYTRLGTWSLNEAEEAASYNRLPGDLKILDADNNGQINDRDKGIIGKGIPDGYGTLLNTFNYKNFDLILEIQYTYGNDVLDISRHSGEDRQGEANSFRSVLGAWTPENQNSDIAQLRPPAAGYDTNIDTRFVEDGSFIRGKNLVVGYNFDSRIAKKLALSKLRVYGSVQNFFLRTRYSGYDPEVSNFGNSFAQGITVFGYPKPRTFLLGLQINF